MQRNVLSGLLIDGTGQESLCALQIGVYNEKALQRLDLIVAEAGSNGVRVMFPFVNFRNDMGGMQWYVDQVCHRALSASSHAAPICAAVQG